MPSLSRNVNLELCVLYRVVCRSGMVSIHWLCSSFEHASMGKQISNNMRICTLKPEVHMCTFVGCEEIAIAWRGTT